MRMKRGVVRTERSTVQWRLREEALLAITTLIATVLFGAIAVTIAAPVGNPVADSRSVQTVGEESGPYPSVTPVNADVHRVAASSSPTNTVVASVPVGTSPATPAFDSTNGDFYVPNQGSSNVSVISGLTNSVVATIPVGGWPQTPTYDSANGDVYVPNRTPGTVSVISGLTNTVVATAVVGGSPLSAAYDSANGDLYVPNYNTGNVSVISTSTNTVVATIPVGGAPYPPTYDSNNGDVYVGNSLSANVSVISGSTNKVVATIPVGECPGTLTQAALNGDLYVGVCPGDMSVISDSTNQVIATVPVGASPFGSAYDTENGDLYVNNNNGDSVSVVSCLTNTVVATLPIGANSQIPFYDPANGDVYVTNAMNPGSVSVISGLNNTVIATVPVGNYPITPVYDNANGELFVANLHGSNVTVISGGPEVVFEVVFEESGLAGGTSWSAVFNGIPGTSAGTGLSFWATAGTHSYQVEPVPGYIASVSNGFASVGNATYLIPVAFTPVTYPIVVTESGLTPGETWTATVNGAVHSTSGTTLSFRLANGTYDYSVSNVSGFTLVGGSGTVEVDGSSASISVGFASVPPVVQTTTVTIREAGLPAGTNWSAIFGGVEESTRGTTLSFTVANGTYSYQVEPVAGYAPSPASGTATVSAGYLISATYQPIATSAPPQPAQVSASDFATGFTIALALAAAAVGFSIATLIRIRRFLSSAE